MGHLARSLAAGLLLAGLTVPAAADRGRAGLERGHHRPHASAHHRLVSPPVAFRRSGRSRGPSATWHRSWHDDHRWRHPPGLHLGFHADGGAALAAGVLGAIGLGYLVSRPPPRAVVSNAPPLVLETVPRRGAIAPEACLERREYRTRVVIDGRPVDAWGVACRGPDGAWWRVRG
ncbi:MAG: hypothetical protein H6983_15715 [Ectothiorhodospiraceae bacterium]|nr:hypothetical protein [Ectothiorhodospiraceae bacterium]